MFFFSFDYRSGWSRKNPDGAVRAFRDANLGDDAVLVVKSSYLTPEFARALREEAGHAAVIFMDGYIDSALLSDLFCAADVYLSLHRCEGFGLGMAESMRLGKTVIGTAYSGNLDYMNPNNSLLVDWTPGHVRRTDLDANPGLETVVDLGSPWAEPSHDAAVAAIRSAMDIDQRIARGARAANEIAQTHSGSTVGERARQRLLVLQHELGLE
jgi:glycosyltransferase involved in cell wall biosynthesis